MMDIQCEIHEDMLLKEHEGVMFCGICCDENYKRIVTNYHKVIPSIFRDLPPHFAVVVECVVYDHLNRDPDDYICEYLALWGSKFCPEGSLDVTHLAREIARTDNPLLFLPLDIQREFPTCLRCPIHSQSEHVEHLSPDCMRVMLCLECIKDVARELRMDRRLPEWFPSDANCSEYCSIDKIFQQLPGENHIAVAVATLSIIWDVRPEEVYS